MEKKKTNQVTIDRRRGTISGWRKPRWGRGIERGPYKSSYTQAKNRPISGHSDRGQSDSLNNLHALSLVGGLRRNVDVIPGSAGDGRWG